MIAVLIAKIVGFAARCPSELETGAPCNWLTYAVFGAIANTTLASRYAHPPAALQGHVPHGVDGTTRALAHPGPLADFARTALYDATHHVFLSQVIAVLLLVGAIALIPRRTTELVFD